MPEESVEPVPYTNETVVALPCGLTLALKVAPALVMAVAGNVIAVGAGVGVGFEVVKLKIGPSVVPRALVATTSK